MCSLVASSTRMQKRMLHRSSLQETENASAAVAKSPDTRVKLSDIEANIACVYYATGDQIAGRGRGHPSLNVLTVCVLTMQNGFTVVGKAAPADEMNFNPELGRKFAYEDAVRQCWPLMGYELRERLFRERGLTKPEIPA